MGIKVLNPQIHVHCFKCKHNHVVEKVQKQFMMRNICCTNCGSMNVEQRECLVVKNARRFGKHRFAVAAVVMLENGDCEISVHYSDGQQVPSTTAEGRNEPARRCMTLCFNVDELDLVPEGQMSPSKYLEPNDE